MLLWCRCSACWDCAAVSIEPSVKVARAAKIIAALPNSPRRCGKKFSPPSLLRAPQEDPWGCPEAVVPRFSSRVLKNDIADRILWQFLVISGAAMVLIWCCQVTKEEFFQRCLAQSKPCVTSPVLTVLTPKFQDSTFERCVFTEIQKIPNKKTESFGAVPIDSHLTGP